MAKEINREIQDVFTYLDLLKDSGITNMFGATPYLVDQFDLDKRTAANYLILYFQANKTNQVMEVSNCCGSEPSYLSDEICGECLEHTCFNEIEL